MSRPSSSRPEWFQGPRIVPRTKMRRRELNEYANEEGWDYEEEIEADEQRGIWHEVRWSVGPGLRVHYIEDPVSSLGYFAVTGEDPQLIQSISAAIADDLETWSIEELSELFDSTNEPHALARTTVYLGLAASHDFDVRVFDRIRRALNHSEPEVRHAAMWAMSYSPWPPYRPLLSDAVRNDPDSDLREAAQAVLDGFDEQGVGEE